MRTTPIPYLELPALSLDCEDTSLLLSLATGASGSGSASPRPLVWWETVWMFVMVPRMSALVVGSREALGSVSGSLVVVLPEPAGAQPKQAQIIRLVKHPKSRFGLRIGRSSLAPYKEVYPFRSGYGNVAKPMEQ